MRHVFSYLTDKPIIGVFSGFGSWVLLDIQSFFLNEHLLKVVAAFGVWLGAFVAGLTLLLKAIEVIEVVSRKFKRK